MHAWSLPYLLAFVERRGADASMMRRLPGLLAADDPDARAPEHVVEAAWSLAAELTRDDAIGILVAESLPRGALDLVEYAFRSSASLGDGLERLARYGRVLSDRVAARTEANDEALLLMVDDVGRTRLHPARTEFALAIAMQLARDGTGHELVPRRVCFRHPAPADDHEHRRFFGTRARFSAGSNSLLLNARDARRPLRDADEALAAIVRRRLERVLALQDARSTGPLSGRVRRVLVESLGRTSVTPDTMAEALGTTRRTLSRRLAAEGTSFRDLHDDVRAEFARVMLGDQGSSVADVAFFLDYSERAAFHRAFRRWTGQTPGEFQHA
ncbi:AraC family transcriptional regulator [Luteitalea pratensis]|uniref:AraC family transcriptional regulator n=1 Tax=Luteitalea pratensis TaxID=1855912 RepID=UPI001390158C|nr:AraC family transcriptional regulator [Luteitalea pratensis]